jgi:DME family drug/metabolite transporter
VTGSHRTGAALVLIATALWGTMGTAQELTPDPGTPMSAGAVRILIGGSALLLAGRLLGLRPPFGARPVIRLQIILGGVAVAVFQVAFFSTMSTLGVALGTVVVIGCAPVFAGLCASFFHRASLTRAWWVATAVAVVGCALVTLPGSGARFATAGIAVAVLAGFSYGVFTVVSKPPVREHEPIVVMGSMLLIGGLLLLPFGLADWQWLTTPSGLVSALYQGLATSAAAFLLFAVGLRHLSSATAATLSLAEPLTAAVLGLVVLGERFHLVQALGGVLLFLALAWTASRPLAREPDALARPTPTTSGSTG